MTTRTTEKDLNDSFDSLAETAIRIANERNALLAACRAVAYEADRNFFLVGSSILVHGARFQKVLDALAMVDGTGTQAGK